VAGPTLGAGTYRRYGVGARLSRQLLPRDAAQGVVDDRHQRIQSLAPIDVRTAKERRDLSIAVVLVRRRLHGAMTSVPVTRF
jgi:hypothetical protein